MAKRKSRRVVGVRFRSKLALEYTVTGVSGQRYCFKKDVPWKQATMVTHLGDIQKFLGMGNALEPDVTLPGAERVAAGKAREADAITALDVTPGRRRRRGATAAATAPPEKPAEGAEVECPKCGIKLASDEELAAHLDEHKAEAEVTDGAPEGEDEVKPEDETKPEGE